MDGQGWHVCIPTLPSLPSVSRRPFPLCHANLNEVFGPQPTIRAANWDLVLGSHLHQPLLMNQIVS